MLCIASLLEGWPLLGLQPNWLFPPLSRWLPFEVLAETTISWNWKPAVFKCPLYSQLVGGVAPVGIAAKLVAPPCLDGSHLKSLQTTISWNWKPAVFKCLASLLEGWPLLGLQPKQLLPLSRWLPFEVLARQQISWNWKPAVFK